MKVAPGQTLGERFFILEEIGRGGMSTVFKALDLEDANRMVAVKVPLPQFSSGLGSWSMFQREAEIGRTLDHPSIVRFIALAPQTLRGHVVTEYIAGPTLATRISRGKAWSEPEAICIVSRLCDAVDYLHTHNIVHYDLKPENVMLCKDGTIRLIDFGMAHPVVKRRFGLAVGSAPALATSRYVAPEQIARRRGQCSVDIYALGAMLYEMLTGHPPFEDDDPFEIASARQIGDPIAPRARNPNISTQAEEITLRALRRDPLERYASVSTLKADLDQPLRVRVTGLRKRLVVVTPWRKRMRVIRFVASFGVAPIAMLLGAFRLLWWLLERGH